MIPDNIRNAHIPISQDKIMEQFNYLYGDEKCMKGLLIWMVFWFVGSIVTINYKFRNLWKVKIAESGFDPLSFWL